MCTKSVELESDSEYTGVWFLSQNQSRCFEGDFDSRHMLLNCTLNLVLRSSLQPI